MDTRPSRSGLGLRSTARATSVERFEREALLFARRPPGRAGFRGREDDRRGGLWRIGEWLRARP